MAVNSDVRAVPLAFVRDVCYSLIMRGQEYVFCEPRSRGERGAARVIVLSFFQVNRTVATLLAAILVMVTPVFCSVID